LLRSRPNERTQFLESLSDAECLMALSDWAFWARPEQLAPQGDWTTWLYLGGRGAGKTRAGAEWLRTRVNAGIAKRIALVAATFAEARDVMVEGESGLLAISSPLDRPKFEISKRRLVWPNGAVALLFSDDEPDMLRGAQHDTAWSDELAKWKHLDATWDNLQLGLRLGERPRQAVTTTPRTKKGLRAIMARSDTVITRGSTHDNRDNLAPAFFRDVIRRYEGTRFGRQEINAELLDDVPGALWTRAMLDAARIGEQMLERELASDLKYWTERGLLALEGVSAEKATEQGGALQKLVMDQLVTGSAVAAQTQQTAATGAGVAARTSLEASGTATGLAVQKAAAASTVSTHAAEAATGAYAAVAGIPIVGPILAPIAAVTAYGAVEAFGSFAVGADNIPHDMVANIHKGEMIIPAGPAESLRNSFSIGGGTVNNGGAQHNWTYAPQISGVPERNIVDELRGSAGEFASFIRDLNRSGSLRFA
jgi:hypothetical protein